MLLFLNSACLFLTENKKAGVPYLREVFIVAIVASAFILLVIWKRAQQSRASLWVLCFGLLLPALSALLANIKFGQPLIFGLLEERRSFLYLLFFPALYLMIKARPTQEELERFFLCCGLACVVVGYLYYVGVIPENNDFAFTVDEKDYGLDPLRPNRFGIGAPYVSACAFMLMYRLKRRFSLMTVLLLLLFVSYLWLVIQTRNTMVIWALAGVWIFRSQWGVLLKVGIAVIGILLVAYLILPEAFFTEQYAKFNALLAEATSDGGVRSTTAHIVLGEVAQNFYMGMGALSLQWQNGFARIYSSYFYLSDVGLLGVYYRYGFLAPIIALIYYIGYWRIMRQCRNKADLLSALQLDFAFNCINFFLSASIMYGGEMAGLAIAGFVYFAQVSVAQERVETSPAWQPISP
ncbi:MULTISPECIES: hypothetical protein [unclassified Pseudomonas]|uniref:hypothetical protein n=1 Tax=unclassified Pseudomonas TaxID=196821 RepID=UPI002AC92E66|nr:MULTISPECIES: hypothetical protein [unclassified Pseudomonas]MEB0039868.1 hypothetical protein [Pseudomonas sp. MH10]MEB0077190.1 hypothetical protein [Pseudomonas sp. MH10out]MEB0091479.1 hypothetical protein [Pseudomonas sp. CCI4.2]MEB0101537.1 hypothetical protein [Pseudomonas sp. CCI3.2]MEB0120648.1 hypothetical protein [Pseudomonas sp. CCI1.2]